MHEDLKRGQKGMLSKSTGRTLVHFLCRTHKLREGGEFVQLVPMAGKDEPMENGVVVLVDRPSESSTMTRHLDNLVGFLWIEDVPTIDKTCDAVQIGEARGQFRRRAVYHLVDT